MHSNLFKDGNKTAFPIANGQMQVTFGLTLNQIVDVEDANEYAILNVWVRQVILMFNFFVLLIIMSHSNCSSPTSRWELGAP